MSALPSFLAVVLLAPGARAQEAPSPCASPECCREAEGAELHGRVQTAEAGAAIPGAAVSIRITAPPEAGEASTRELRTAEDGTYRICGLPTPARLEARAERSGATSRSVSFQLDAPQRVELSFEIQGLPANLDSLERAAAAAREAAEPGRIVGRIEDASTGRPVSEATVILTPGDRRALTDGEGRFTIPEAPAGVGKLAIRHVGYGDRTVEVDVPSELTLNLDIALPPEAIEVEEVTVRVESTVRSRYLESRGFYERMDRGFGHFWSPERLERRNPLRASHVLQQTPGVRIIRKCGTAETIWPRCIHLPANTRGCPSTVYLDGHKMKLGQETRMGLDDLVSISSLAAIEVYSGPAGTAPEFIDSDSRCGVVVLWTKHGLDARAESRP